jgi:integrase/recombinase XerD
LAPSKSWASTGRALYDYFSFLQAHERSWDDVDRGEEKTPLAAYRDYSSEVAKLARSTMRNRLLYVCEFYSFAQRQKWIETPSFGYETRRVIKSAGLLAHLDASGGRASVRDVMPRAHKDWPRFPSGEQSRHVGL